MTETFRQEITKEEFPELEELADLIKHDIMFRDGVQFFTREYKGDIRTRELVGSYRGFKFEIFSREHPPPHFRAWYQGQSASFSIDTCERLRGNKGLEQNESAIRKWWKDNKEKLIEVWNRTRPDDCPVGKIKT